MENNSVYNVFDLYTTPASEEPREEFSFMDLFKPWKFFMPDKGDGGRESVLPEIPEELRKLLLKYGNRISGIPNGRKSIDFDFED